MNYSYQLVSKKNNISYTYYIKIPEYIAKNQLGLSQCRGVGVTRTSTKAEGSVKMRLKPYKETGKPTAACKVKER